MWHQNYDQPQRIDHSLIIGILQSLRLCPLHYQTIDLVLEPINYPFFITCFYTLHVSVNFPSFTRAESPWLRASQATI
jgi:hypothetical protein